MTSWVDVLDAFERSLDWHQELIDDAVDRENPWRTPAAGIAINPAAFTHTSIAIHDAVRACECPIIEVHLSNVHAREAFRHHSYVSPVAAAVIAGCGTQGYRFAIERLARLAA